MHRNFTPSLRRLLFAATCVAASVAAQAAGTKTTYTVRVQRTAGQSASQYATYPKTLLQTLGSSSSTLSAAFSNGVKLYAVQPTGRYYGTYNNSPNGFKFNTSGTVVASSKKVAVATTLDLSDGVFSVSTVDSMLTRDSIYTVREAFVNSTSKDTVVYEFKVSVGDVASVESDEPEFLHRSDVMDSWVVYPYVQRNDQAGETSYCLQVDAGDRATLGMRTKNEGETLRFRVMDADDNVLRTWGTDDYEIASADVSDAGYYQLQVRLKGADGKYTVKTYTYVLDVQTEQGAFYDWSEHTARFSYNYIDEFPDGFPQPTKSHNIKKQDGTAANRVDGDWWCAYWGDNLNSEVDGNNKNAFTNMVEKFDTDFAYIRDVMGWPPDANIRNGWRSFIYTFGSGLANDNTDNTVTGGYQSATGADGGTWVCVWASYYPVSRFRDDADSKWSDGEYQRNAMVHEGIHALLASMDGAKNSAWFQEGGNTWLQAKMTVLRDGVVGDAGFLDGTIFIAPFMPIECYSGWLQDGSFGGPSAEGVNMYNSSGAQVCTWRTTLGGTQYANGFPIFLGEAVGDGSVPWIWRYAKNRVLEGIANGCADENIEGIGDEATRSLVLQYRAKQATFDIGEFAKSYRSVMDGNFGGSIGPEWEPYWIDCDTWVMTPYATLTQNDAAGWLAPDTITNPGWSGGNQIPIHVTGNHCEVYFRPEDTNMRAQLCYRTKDGQCFYSQPALCGKLELNWADSIAPSNGVVFCVVCNTDYIYTGDTQRKHHWDYRIKLGDGALAVASNSVRWYLWENTLRDTDFETGIENVAASGKSGEGKLTGGEGDDLGIRLLSSTLQPGGQVRFDLGQAEAGDIVAHLTGLSGVMIDEQPMSDNGTIRLPHTLPSGMYVLTLARGEQKQSYKVFVK